ncbi:MAG: hypothetical protein QFX32_05750 [Methanolinea sp.]|nr:hypothetical protein [Methanolinea sp.]
METSRTARLLARYRENPRLARGMVLARRAFREAIAANRWPQRGTG